MIDELPDYGVEDSQAVEPWQEETQESQGLPSEDHVYEGGDHVTYDDASHVSDVSESEAETQQVSFNQPPPSTQPRNWLKRVAVESPLQGRHKTSHKKRVSENPVKSVRFDASGDVPISSSPVVVLSSEMSRPSPSQVPITPITPADVANPPSTPDKYIVDVVPSTTPSYSPLTMEFVEEGDTGGVARRLFSSKDESGGVFTTTADSQVESFHNVADSQWQDEVLCSEDEEEDVQVVPSSSQDQEVLTDVHGLTQDETVDETPDGQNRLSQSQSERATEEESQYVPGETQYGPGDSLYEPETQYTDGEEETQYADDTVRPNDNPVTDSQYDPSDELLEDVHRDGQGYDFTQSITDERQKAIEVSDDEEEEEEEENQPPASMDEFHDAHESLSEEGGEPERSEEQAEEGERQEIDLLSSIHDADYIHSSVHSPESMSEGNAVEAHSVSDEAASPSSPTASLASPNQPPPFTQPYKHHIIPDSDDEESRNSHFSQRFSQKVFKPFKQPSQTQPPALKRVKAAESQEPQPITESQMLMSGLFVDTAPFDDEEDVVIPVRRQNDTIDEDEYVSDSQDEGDVFPRPSLKREAFAHLPPLPPKPSITSSEMETQNYLGHSITDTLLEPLSDPESLTQDESER